MINKEKETEEYIERLFKEYEKSVYDGATCDASYHITDKDSFIAGYSKAKEETELMNRKLRAVLKGADVIEMPSNEELEIIAELEYPAGTDDYLCAKGIKLAQAAFNGGVNWLKSKIVK